MAEQEISVIKTAEEFFFKTPLYAPVKFSPGNLDAINPKMKALSIVYALGRKVDGYCPDCRREVTFRVHSPEELELHELKSHVGFDESSLTCDRNPRHVLHFVWQNTQGVLTKYGQWPSLADIEAAGNAGVAKLLGRPDAHEFNKAVGLAAHGVGIGSFVYFRRVFERLIQRRFDEVSEQEGWKAEDFKAMRMSEKIKLLKSHLPDFLVENAQVYSILSVGIHSLDEKQCLGFFPLMRDSIIVILEEDERRKERDILRKDLAAALKNIDLSKIKLEDEDG